MCSGTRRLIEATADAARRGNDGDRHTVAGGILTASGEILTAMNAHHFTGGPCGEVSALALHAATMPDDPIVAVAAVHGPSGQVISPCGKCRQIFFERNPEICFVVREPAGLVELPVEQLLPNAYSSARLESPQEMHMAAGGHTGWFCPGTRCRPSGWMTRTAAGRPCSSLTGWNRPTTGCRS